MQNDLYTMVELLSRLVNDHENATTFKKTKRISTDEISHLGSYFHGWMTLSVKSSFFFILCDCFMFELHISDAKRKKNTHTSVSLIQFNFNALFSLCLNFVRWNLLADLCQTFAASIFYIYGRCLIRISFDVPFQIR